MSFLTNATIAFCGTIDESSKQAILNYLQPFHVRICTLSKEAKFLIVGNDYKEKYKYKLLKKTAQCISYKDILDRIPTIQTALACGGSGAESAQLWLSSRCSSGHLPEPAQPRGCPQR